ADRGEKVRLAALGVEGEAARDTVAGELVAQVVDQLEVRLADDRAHAHQGACERERLRRGGGFHVPRRTVATGRDRRGLASTHPARRAACDAQASGLVDAPAHTITPID